jgi:hypothetical protein
MERRKNMSKEAIDIFEEMEADAVDAAVIPNDQKLASIASIAQSQLNLEKEIERQENSLKTLKRLLKDVQTRELPDAMTELGLSEIKLDTGEKITIKPFVSASISADNKEAAHVWLRDNGHGDLIKHTVTADVGRDQTTAYSAIQALSKLGLTPVDKEAVHTGTLKVFVREQVEAAQSLPLELFGAYMGQRSTITKG